MCKVRTFSQMSFEERLKIKALLETGHSQKDIAQLLNRSASTISREFNRNIAKRGRGSGHYCAESAQRKTVQRHKNKPKAIKLTDELKCKIKKLIVHDRLSPELISGRAKLEKVEMVSHETIYKFIWTSKHGNKRSGKAYKTLHKFLKHYGRRRKRGNVYENRARILNRIPISQRPDHINLRKRFGHAEMDIVLGKNRKPGILIIQDRKSRKTWLKKIEHKNAKYINSKIKSILNRTEKPIRSITTDNDLAFANHHQLNIDVYFTNPYSSQEKGSVENRIGQLRRFFPKRTNFDEVSESQINKVEHLLNNRPLKMFNYKTPNEVYFSNTLALMN